MTGHYWIDACFVVYLAAAQRLAIPATIARWKACYKRFESTSRHTLCVRCPWITNAQRLSANSHQPTRLELNFKVAGWPDNSTLVGQCLLGVTRRRAAIRRLVSRNQIEGQLSRGAATANNATARVSLR